MNIRFATEPLAQISADVLVVGTGPNLDGPIAALDERFDGRFVAELKARRFKGAEGAVFVLPTLGRIAARSLVVVGTGDGSWSSLRIAAGRAGKEARALHAGTPVVAADGSAVIDCPAIAQAVHRAQPARSRSRRSSRPVPKPQAALTLRANAHTRGFQPPAKGRPLSGATTISATMLVISAPRMIAAGQ